MRHIPNIISILRIVASLMLLFFFGKLSIFIPLYLFAGITDALDGFIARRLKVESTLGARLDSIGDFFFFIVLLIYLFVGLLEVIFPFIIPVLCIAGIKLLNIAIGFIRFRRLTMLHTIANKAAGLVIYFVPVFIWLGFNQILFITVIVASLAAIEETLILIKSPRGHIDLNRKSLFF